MKNIKFLAFVLIIIVLLSCNKITHHNIPDPTLNTPVITNVEDAYTYTINAHAFSDSLSGILDFSSDETVITYTVLNYSQGSADLKIDNAASTTIYNDMIENNVVLVESLHEKPHQIELVLENFTGLLELVLACEN